MDRNDRRRRLAVKDRLLTQILHSVFANTATVGTGLILILAAAAMRAGTFSVGDLALFVYYLGFLTEFTSASGDYLAHYKQAGVSLERLTDLLQDASGETLVAHKPLHLRGALPPLAYTAKAQAHRLDNLKVRGLTYHHAGAKEASTTAGIEDVHLDLRRGSFTVVTGRVGAGKTTLLRALLGLLPQEAGQISAP